MRKSKNKSNTSGRFDQLTKFEKIALYVLPLLFVMNIYNAFDVSPAYAGTSAALMSSGFDLLVAAIEAGAWVYLLSGRSILNPKKNQNDSD